MHFNFSLVAAKNLGKKVLIIGYKLPELNFRDLASSFIYVALCGTRIRADGNDIYLR